MSTTISYKGNTIATLTNETKTLSTAGTWMEGNVVVTDQESTAIIIDTVDQAGGTIRTITTTNELHMQSSKTVTPTSSPQTILPNTGYDGFASVTVNGASGITERPEATENDVILIDFDGRILYSYSAVEFANLSELPTLPVLKYSFLQQDGWNWTLSDAKTYVAKYGELVIGAQYITVDGKTHELYEIPYDGMAIAISVNIRNLGSSSGNTITINWGDNSENSVETGLGRNVTKSYSHTYATKGIYHIIIDCTNPNYQITDGGQNSNRQGFIKALTMCVASTNVYQAGNYDLILCSGCSTTIGSMAKWHWGDAYVYPRGYATSYGNSNWFSGAASQGVKYVSWPNGVVGALYGYNYSNCRNLRKLTAPESSIQINASCFNECRTLWKLNIPSGVTTIAQQAFNNCNALRELHFYPTTPPTVENANAFNGLNTACKIYVPTGKLTDYITASNYPDSETYTYVEE